MQRGFLWIGQGIYFGIYETEKVSNVWNIELVDLVNNVFCKQGTGISFWTFPPCLLGHPDP